MICLDVMGAFARIFRNVFLARNSSLKFIFGSGAVSQIIALFAHLQRFNELD